MTAEREESSFLRKLSKVLSEDDRVMGWQEAVLLLGVG